MVFNRGNASIIIISVLAILLVISATAAGYLYLQSQNQIPPVQYTPPPSAQPTVQPSPTPTPAPITQDETANWKTYTDSKYNYSVSYPNNWTYELSLLPYQQAESLGLHSPPKNTDPNDPTRFSDTAFIQITASTGDYSSIGINKEWTTNTSIAGLDAYKKLTPATNQASAQELVAFKKGDQYFIAFMSYTKPEFVKTFDQILSTFKFL